MSAGKNETNATTLLNAEASAVGNQSVNLDSAGVGTMVAARVLKDIDTYCATEYDGGHRSHLGGSLIGDPCKRKLWYSFRWTFREKHDGRQQRLFNRGHREEDRFVEWLRGIGAQVWTHSTPTVFNERGEIVQEGTQYRISGTMGHFGGSLDGICILPERYNYPDPILLEFKTNGTGPAFKKLLESKVAIAKPMHYAQMSTYGVDDAYQFRHALYMNICKNDDNMHVEIVKLDWNLGKQMRQKAEEIILSPVPPPRLSDNPTYKDCQYCAASKICHQGAIAEKNCRSCTYAVPVEGAQWFCNLPANNGVIPKDFIPQGCGGYHPITSASQK